MSSLSTSFTSFILEQTRARNADVLAFEKLSGGAIQDNFGLSLYLEGGSRPGTQHFVVRQDAPSGVAESLTRPQEFAVLRRAFEAGVSAPEPLWICNDTSLTGRVFYVMARAGGTASPRRLVKADYSPEERRAIVFRFGEELARLHSIQPPEPALEFLPLPNPKNAALSRVNLYRRYLSDIGEPHPVLEWALNWLEDQAPEPDQLVLCHCDFRTGNYMLQDNQLSAILDWEFASWSDPCEDLGWLCSRSWRFGANDYEVGGIGFKSDLFAGYHSVSNRSLDPQRVRYWEVMALVRWAAIALQQARRHMSGEQPSLELALTGRMVAQMEFDLLNQITESGAAA
ncbi:MAG: phosphotransferase family protein [Pseudomonadota bacterium]|nr:phosphotransferase family protein [Pseudomonadota bacterium]